MCQVKQIKIGPEANLARNGQLTLSCDEMSNDRPRNPRYRDDEIGRQNRRASLPNVLEGGSYARLASLPGVQRRIARDAGMGQPVAAPKPQASRRVAKKAARAVPVARAGTQRVKLASLADLEGGVWRKVAQGRYVHVPKEAPGMRRRAKAVTAHQIWELQGDGKDFFLVRKREERQPDLRVAGAGTQAAADAGIFRQARRANIREMSGGQGNALRLLEQMMGTRDQNGMISDTQMLDRALQDAQSAMEADGSVHPALNAALTKVMGFLAPEVQQQYSQAFDQLFAGARQARRTAAPASDAYRFELHAMIPPGGGFNELMLASTPREFYTVLSDGLKEVLELDGWTTSRYSGEWTSGAMPGVKVFLQDVNGEQLSQGGVDVTLTGKIVRTGSPGEDFDSYIQQTMDAINDDLLSGAGRLTLTPVSAHYGTANHTAGELPPWLNKDKDSDGCDCGCDPCECKSKKKDASIAAAYEVFASSAAKGRLIRQAMGRTAEEEQDAGRMSDTALALAMATGMSGDYSPPATAAPGAGPAPMTQEAPVGSVENPAVPGENIRPTYNYRLVPSGPRQETEKVCDDEAGTCEFVPVGDKDASVTVAYEVFTSSARKGRLIRQAMGREAIFDLEPPKMTRGPTVGPQPSGGAVRLPGAEVSQLSTDQQNAYYETMAVAPDYDAQDAYQKRLQTNEGGALDSAMSGQTTSEECPECGGFNTPGWHTETCPAGQQQMRQAAEMHRGGRAKVAMVRAAMGFRGAEEDEDDDESGADDDMSGENKPDDETEDERSESESSSSESSSSEGPAASEEEMEEASHIVDRHEIMHDRPPYNPIEDPVTHGVEELMEHDPGAGAEMILDEMDAAGYGGGMPEIPHVPSGLMHDDFAPGMHGGPMDPMGGSVLMLARRTAKCGGSGYHCGAADCEACTASWDDDAEG